MLLIRDGTIYTMAGGILDIGDIVLEDGKILEIGKEIKTTIKNDDIIIDASGLWVMPGLILLFTMLFWQV